MDERRKLKFILYAFLLLMAIVIVGYVLFTVVAMFVEGKILFNPPVDYPFQLGDVLIVLGREDQINKLRNIGDDRQ